MAKRKAVKAFKPNTTVPKAANDERVRAERILPSVAKANGNFAEGFVTHVETNTKAQTFRRVMELPVSVRSWAAKGYPGFERPALDAILHCLLIWEARPLLGRLCASYEPTIPGGTSGPEEALQRNLDHMDELARYQAMFHPAHWRVFVAVVRDGKPVCNAANEIENNAPQSTASARAIVGLVANVIAMKMGA